MLIKTLKQCQDGINQTQKEIDKMQAILDKDPHDIDAVFVLKNAKTLLESLEAIKKERFS